MTDTKIERISQVASGNVLGLVGDATHPVDGSTAAVAAASAKRTAPLRRFLDAITSAPLTGKPWVPDLTPPSGGGLQVGAEKSAFPVVNIHVTGATITPALLGAVANVSWQVYSQAGSVIEVLLREAALRQAVSYITTQLTTGAPTADTIPLAAELVETAGWPIDLVAGPTAEMLAADLTNLDLIGIPAYGGLPGAVIVASRGGVWCEVSETDARVAEPAIGGYEVSAFIEVVCKVTVGSVATAVKP
jgi:hypothetical protein